MAAGIEIRAEEVDTLAFGSISASYTAIGDPFEHPIRILTIQNLTDATLMFSFDGVVDHIALPASGQVIFDATTNRVDNAQGFFFSVGSLMSVKRIGTPTSGSVYVSAFYARGS